MRCVREAVGVVKVLLTRPEAAVTGDSAPLPTGRNVPRRYYTLKESIDRHLREAKLLQRRVETSIIAFLLLKMHGKI